MSGLWLAVVGAVFYFSPWYEQFLTHLLIASPVIGGLHSFFPLLAAVSSTAFIERLRPQKQKILLYSVFIVGVSFAMGILGSQLAQPEFWILLGYGYLVWNTWHFAAQNFGVMCLYRAKSEQSRPLEVKIDKFYCLIMGCLIQPIIWFCIEARWGLFLRLKNEDFPAQFVTQVTLGFATLLTLAFVIWEAQKKQRSWPKILFAFSLLLQPFAGVMAYYPFHFLIYSIPHWMVEIGITGTIQANNAKKQNTGFKAALSIAGFLLTTALLIYWLEPTGYADPAIFTWWDELAWRDIGNTESLYLQLTLPTLVTLLLIPRSFLHFYLSRQIYKSTSWTLLNLRKE